MQGKTNIYERVTATIIADLEKGVRPWVKPWNAEHLAGKVRRPERHSGEPYHGINVLTLWLEAVAKGFSSPRWLTYRQAQTLGAQVRAGEKGSPVVYADRMVKTEQDAKGQDFERAIPFLKAYTVFNAEQIDGLPPSYHAAPVMPTAPTWATHAKAEQFTGSVPADIRHGGVRAYYSPATDHVQMPPRETFADAEGYYATLLHELTHWTRHSSRLDRSFSCKRWGDAGYATEELVAELGAAFLSADLGVTPTVREDHAAYLASWLSVLKSDSKAIFTAAAHAERAVEFLWRTQSVERPAA